MALFPYLYIMEAKEIQALFEENKRLQAQVEKLSAEKAELENAVSSLKSMMEWYRKKLFGKMSEKNLPLDPSALEPTLFDEQLSEEEQAALDAEVKSMEEQNAKVIEVKAHKREVRKPVYSNLRPLHDKLREQIMNKDYIQVDESTLPVIDNEKHRAVKGYMWVVRDAVGGSVYFHYDMGSRSGETAVKLIGKYRGAVQTDGYEVYESFENAPGKRMIGCWAQVRRKFVDALDEDRKHASEAIVYISKLYKLEAEMKEAKLKPDAIKERREKEAYPIIQAFEKWMNTVAGSFAPKSRMGKAIVYTYSLLPRLSRYVLDGRYNIDNNGVENAIRPLALGRKNYLFCGNHDAAVRATIIYSLFASCKAHDIDIRNWLEDTLKRLPTEKDITMLLPENWQPVTAK